MVAGIESQNHASLHLHETLGFITTGQMPQVGTKLAAGWIDLYAAAAGCAPGPGRQSMNASLTLACLIAAGVGGGAEHSDGAHHPVGVDDPYRYAAQFAGRDRYLRDDVTAARGVAGFQELALSVKWWTLIPGLLGSFFVFASISGYQNVGAATTIAVLVASQLVGGLIMDLVRAHGVPVRR